MLQREASSFWFKCLTSMLVFFRTSWQESMKALFRA